MLVAGNDRTSFGWFAVGRADLHQLGFAATLCFMCCSSFIEKHFGSEQRSAWVAIFHSRDKDRIFASSAEFDRKLIRERTITGLTAARGRKCGLPPKLSAKEIKTIRALLKTVDIPATEIAARFGIARTTLYRTILKPAA